jgi:polysaccharide export outer membrane protein
LFHTIEHRIALITSLAILNNCGTLYISPTVPLNDPNVQIVEVTQGVVKIANSSAYSPRALPRPRSADITAINLQSGQPMLPRVASRQQTNSASPVLRLPPQTKTKRYQIGVSDVVSLTGRSKPIAISGAEDQRRSNIYTVQDSGAIALPDVGSIKVAGLTIQDAHSAAFKRRAAN